jgi:hypothetical protein
VSEAVNRRAAAQQAAAKVLREELERAERRGEDRIRQRVLAIPDSKRFMHSVGDVTFEVIEAAAVEEAIGVTEP